LQISDAGLTKSLERLSSGYRINRAADDAAGLAISSAFRADIASYKVASRNASEASSMLQVAEGAAEQIQNMLVRLKELATQGASANAGSNLDKINSEKTQLLAEIEKIAQSTEYADTALVDGTYGVAAASTGALLTTGNGYESLTGMKQGYSYVVTVVDTAGSVADITIAAYSNVDDTPVATQTLFNQSIPSTGSTNTISFGALGVDLKVNSAISETITGGAANATVVAAASGNATFQVGAENNADNQITISLGDMTRTGLGINTLDLSTAAGALSAMDLLDTAIGSLNTVRGNIGAYMNQLSYHAANLASTIENVTASESTIRDVDMAAEMTTFTKNQILLQSGTAMLAQANMAPQQLLALFG
jgi:flagellin